MYGGFLGGSDSKASACNAGDPGSTPGSGRSPGKGNGNPLQYSYLENFHGQRSLVGYSPWGHKESDTTERLHFHICVYYKMLHICTHSIFLIHSVTDRCLVCFPILATVNS